jgi:hypothetical protein
MNRLSKQIIYGFFFVALFTAIIAVVYTLVNR